MNFYIQFNAQKLVPPEFVNIFSTSFGELDIHNILDWETFGESILSGKISSLFFLLDLKIIISPFFQENTLPSFLTIGRLSFQSIT